jgi:hypothetical protein
VEKSYRKLEVFLKSLFDGKLSIFSTLGTKDEYGTLASHGFQAYSLSSEGKPQQAETSTLDVNKATHSSTNALK